MKIGFLFPGQGAQSVGMGKDLYEKYEEVRNVYLEAEKILGIDVARLTFESSEEELSQTKNTQIAILVMSLGILEILKKNGIKAESAAGLSLGEYSALICAESINFEDGLKIVKKRGELMQNYSPEGNWAMAAILGLEDEKVEEACKNVTKGFVVPANYNCPGQIAISGDKQGVEEAMELAKELGARKAVELKTSGPFHTEKLHVASEKLREELEKIVVKLPEIEVIKNIDATPYTKDDDMKEILAKHVTHSVKFAKSAEYMIKSGVDVFVEIGPGKTLTGFVKRISKDVKLININDVTSLESAIQELKV
jgi:[acyl-carrier-protein] S-malonyltransferase